MFHPGSRPTGATTARASRRWACGGRWMVWSLLFIVLVLQLSGSASAQALASAFHIIEQAVADGSLPGASVLIMRHGKVIDQRSFGDCELDPKRPFQLDTICWIASLTKPITAAAAMKLVEGGKLDLDRPIADYLPQFSQLVTEDGQQHAVTIRQLMSHTSGIPAAVPLREPYFFTQSWFQRKLTDVVDAIARRPLDFAPGSQVHYSNAAPYVLGRIIEVSSGKDFGEFVQREICEPLQMNDTSFAVAADKIHRTAVVYRREPAGLSIYCRYDPQWQVKIAMPDGGLFSTPRDIACFANAFLQRGGGLLSESSVRTMLTPHSAGYGLGWILDQENQFSHWGSSGTLVWADKKTGVVGVFFSQLQDLKLLARLRERFRRAVDQALAATAEAR
jgi:CubicO group peptidase (beta-lactamase class C family)